MKKKVIFLVCVILLVVFGFIFYRCVTSEYQGEYYSEYPVLVGQYTRDNPRGDMYDDFYGTFLFDYEEYRAYCSKYGLVAQYYSGNKKYIVHAMSTTGWFYDSYVKKVKIHGQKAEILIHYSVKGASDAEFDSELFVIPVDSSVTSVSLETKVKDYN